MAQLFGWLASSSTPPALDLPTLACALDGLKPRSAV